MDWILLAIERTKHPEHRFKGKRLTQASSFQTLDVLLGTVIMASLTLVLFGLNPTPGPAEVLQLPVMIAEVSFVFAVVRQVGIGEVVASLSPLQRSLAGALAIYVLVVSVTSPVVSAAIFGPFWLVHIAFFIALFAFFRRCKPANTDWIWTLVGVTGLLHAITFAVAWFGWPDAIRDGVFPAFDNIRHLGYFLAPAAAVMAVLFVRRQGHGALLLLCYFAASFYLIYSGSRGGAVALVAGLLIIAFYLWWHQLSVSLGRVLIVIALTGASVVLCEFLPHLPWEPIFSRGVETANQTGTQRLGGRAAVWANSWGAITQNWLTGYGPALMGQIPEYLGPPYRHPHNIVLQVLLHWGVVGTAIICALLFTFLHPMVDALTRRPVLALAPLAVVVTMLIHALVDGGLYYPYSTVLAIIGFAALVGLQPEEIHAAR